MTVDHYVETNLDSDPLGAQVRTRMEQEQLVCDVAYIAKDVAQMRTALLGFIASGELPPITMKAWGIVDGKDIS